MSTLEQLDAEIRNCALCADGLCGDDLYFERDAATANGKVTEAA